MDDWNIPKIPQDTLYIPETIKDKYNFDYIIKTIENNIPLGQDIGKEFHLLSKNSIYEHSRKYKYLHIGCVQVAIKPLIDMGIDAIVLMCLRDIRQNKFEDSLIGTVETSLGQGPVYFNCYLNKTVSLMDINILDSLFLNIHLHGLDMKEGSILAALIYRIQYKVMNTCVSRVLLKPLRGETTLFITDMTKANVSLPRTIKRDDVTLSEKWVMDKATPSIPRPAPTIEQIKQDNFGNVEITFNRRNSFSSRIEASRSEYESANSNNKPVMAVPFKTKDVNEEVTSKDIKSLMEQANYTNKHLQVLGETIKTKVVPKQKSVEEASLSIPIEKTLFKPFKISDKAKQKIRELRKNKSLIEAVGDNHSELLNKIGSLLKSFSANNIYEWNIDAQTEYNIMNTLQHMTMVATAYQTSHECSEETIIDILVARFSGQLKGCAIKTDLNEKVITNDDDKEIPDAVSTLIFTIAQDFIGDPSLWKDRSAELLSNLKCKTLADFRWYKDTFLTRVYTREDSQQPFWKEKFLAGLPRSLRDKVRDKIRSQSVNGDIPYESLSYGQLISYVQKVALTRFPKKRYSHKPSTSKEIENPRQKSKLKITCYNCEKQGHISKYCMLKKKLRNLNLEPDIEEKINNLLIETSEEETETSSSVLSDENLNIIQQDDQLASTDDDGQINTLTREQDLLFEAINSIPDPQEKKVFLEKLKKTLEVKPKQKEFITNNKFDLQTRSRTGSKSTQNS
ncbi:hypothetical protein JHK82_022880 [Glycine max]|uniref:CCHC-type domain-containing protein n=1 Tax=Glycine max TaxID=3847 RepID=A0A0R0IZF7_SOYBN|nr:hypothetical protein JHK85_023392 [Glycine max]KAG5027010.1 hypothetical protein JHK86_022924 [Glycine max]KAG5138149.1 hypothetical protein JHK82_022880 [Glycine max]KRH45715.1 hypothetical protein GLYMA_08G289400v4 [Glycine max]